MPAPPDETAKLDEKLPAALRPERLAMIDAALAEAVDRAALPEKLDEPVRYALLSPGKRLRPALALASAEAAGGRANAALPAAIAVEMIHAFSLVHDDLPAMDDDDLRRGRPTTHVRFGEAAAILAGDALMSLAYREILRAPVDPPGPARLSAELAEATTAMIAGQTDDTLGAGEPSLETLRQIHVRKTGALLRACCRMGGISAGASAEALDALTRCGDALGLAYQIADDLLDVEQTAEALGKRTGKDADRGKLTYPGVLGVEASRAELDRLHDEAIEALTPLGAPAEALRELCRALRRRDR
jgi:geranylgeranyl diphosphate synthase type II